MTTPTNLDHNGNLSKHSGNPAPWSAIQLPANIDTQFGFVGTGSSAALQQQQQQLYTHNQQQQQQQQQLYTHSQQQQQNNTIALQQVTPYTHEQQNDKRITKSTTIHTPCGGGGGRGSLYLGHGQGDVSLSTALVRILGNHSLRVGDCC